MAEPVITFTSPDSDVTFYACGECRLLRGTDRVVAVACCLCPACGHLLAAGDTVSGLHEACWSKRQDLRRLDALEKALSLPVAEPTEVVWINDHYFFEGIEEAAEYVWDEGDDPATTIAHPCTSRPAHTPDILEIVETSWGEEFDEFEAGEWVSPALKQQIAELQTVLEKAAPDVWHPDTRVRLAVPDLSDSTENDASEMAEVLTEIAEAE